MVRALFCKQVFCWFNSNQRLHFLMPPSILHSKINTKKPRLYISNITDIEAKKLGLAKSDIMGLSYFNRLEIKIPKNTKRQPWVFLYTLIHEHIHCLLPKATERQVVDMSVYFAKMLWRNGFRQKK